MGLGLDRILMLRKGIDDIRVLRAADPRVTAQLSDLGPYRRVSRQPAVARDLSLAVAGDDSAELLGDRVRSALGQAADQVETVAVLSETPYRMLPPPAVDRLGIAPGQKNVLVRVVLRRLDRALTHAEANRLRNAIYAALHQGSRTEWASDAGC
jgi:phenylalanyl-tRNA synthetase alpha chain